MNGTFAEKEITSQEYGDIAREQQAEALSEIGDWMQVAGAFLIATKGDRAAAEALFERQLDRLIDGGALSMRAYRGILAGIRAGL